MGYPVDRMGTRPGLDAHESLNWTHTMNTQRLCPALLAILIANGLSATAQTSGSGPASTPSAQPPGAAPAAAPAPRPVPPTRDPNTPGYVAAKELPDGAVPPPDADGNFIIGPTHNPAPEMTAQEGVPQGTVTIFTMSSADSKIYPGIARDAGT